MFGANRIPKAHQAAFDRETASKAADGVWVMSLIAFILFPLTTFFDQIMYPSLLEELSMWRFATSAAGLIFVGVQAVARRSDAHVRFAHIFVAAFCAISCVGLDGLIMTAGGPESPYYNGLTMLVVGVVVVMPYGMWPMTSILAAIIIQFNIAAVLFDELTKWRLYVNANYFYWTIASIGLLGVYTRYRLRVQEFIGRMEVEEERARNEELLLNMLPEEVAFELRNHGRVEARHIPDCTIMFSDFVGFTQLSGRVDPGELVRSLDRAFSRFDEIVTRWGLEKLKTIGDSYMCAGGVLGSQPDHLIANVLAGLEMLRALEEEALTAPDGSRWNMRVGIHSGPVVAGVIGARRFAYDLWGDTVNTASRLESAAQPGTLNLATEIYDTVREFFVGVDRGFVPVRGKGPMAMTRVLRLRSQYAQDDEGRLPNERFFADLEAWIDHRGTQSTVERHILPARIVDGASHSALDPLRTFTMLTPEDRRELMRIAESVPIQRGQVLIEEGQGLSVLFLVVEGLLGVRMARDGVDIEVAVLGSGEIVGELSFVSLEPASATVVGMEDGTALRFDLDELRAMTAEMPGTGARLFHSLALVLARRVREANARLFSFGSRSETLALERASKVMLDRLPAVLVDAVHDAHAILRPLAEDAFEDSEQAFKDVQLAMGKLLFTAGAALVTAEAAQRSAIGAYALREAYPFLLRSVLIERCLVNEDGCLSDSLALQAIRERRALSEDPLGRLIDRWFVELPLARAIDGATAFMTDFVVDSYKNRVVRKDEEPAWRITSLASGPASELFDALVRLEYPQEARLTCVDGETDDLMTVGRRARAEGLIDQFTLIRSRVLMRAAMRSMLRLVPQDLIYCQFFTTDLEDAVFVELLDEIYRLLAPGGAFVFGQLFMPEPTRLVLRYLLDWPVSSRGNQAIDELVASSSFGDADVEHRRDADGLYGFAIVRRPR